MDNITDALKILDRKSRGLRGEPPLVKNEMKDTWKVSDDLINEIIMMQRRMSSLQRSPLGFAYSYASQGE